eukprot:214182-Hanusia_phi.AAC.1
MSLQTISPPLRKATTVISPLPPPAFLLYRNLPSSSAYFPSPDPPHNLPLRLLRLDSSQR